LPTGASMVPNVLFIDDDANLLRGLCRVLRNQPFQMLTARSAEEALEIVKAWPIDMVVSDEHMPGQRGSDLLKWMSQHCPDIGRIMLCGKSTADLALRAVDEEQIFRLYSKECDHEELAAAILEGIETRSPSVAAV